MWDSGRDVGSPSSFRRCAYICFCVFVLACTAGGIAYGADEEKDGVKSPRGPHVGASGDGKGVVVKLERVDFMSPCERVWKDGTHIGYEEPEWQDNARDGEVQKSQSDNRSPVCCRTDMPIDATAYFFHRNAESATVLIKGTTDAPGVGDWPASIASIDGRFLCYQGATSGAFDSEVRRLASMETSWQYSTNEGENWRRPGPTGKSVNEVFVVRGPVEICNRQRTVLYHATVNTRRTETEIRQKTWAQFSGLDTMAWVDDSELVGTYDRPLKYYGTSEPDGAGACEPLLLYGDGDCVAWADFLQQCFLVNDIDCYLTVLGPPTTRRLNVAPAGYINGFKTTKAGQNCPKPARSLFMSHCVVERQAEEGTPPAVFRTIWDPSYGKYRRSSLEDPIARYTQDVVEEWACNMPEDQAPQPTCESADKWSPLLQLRR